MTVAIDQLNRTLRLDNELSAWAASCSSWSVTGVTTKASGYTFPCKMINLTLVVLIPLNLYWWKVAFLLSQYLGSDTRSQFSVTTELKYAILQ